VQTWFAPQAVQAKPPAPQLARVVPLWQTPSELRQPPQVPPVQAPVAVLQVAPLAATQLTQLRPWFPQAVSVSVVRQPPSLAVQPAQPVFLQAPAEQPWAPVQEAQVAPETPHAVTAEPVWQAPVESQQPLQVWAQEAPPPPPLPPPVPVLLQAPAEQVWVEVQLTHAAPLSPQAWLSAASLQAPLESQQPEQLLALQGLGLLPLHEGVDKARNNPAAPTKTRIARFIIGKLLRCCERR
jgi:hypothetical protein